MRDGNFLRIFLLLTLCTGYLVSFSHFGVFAYEKFFGSSSQYSDGTTLGTIPAARISSQALQEQLAAEVESWQKTHSIMIHYKEKIEVLPMDIFSFNIEDSVLGIESGEKNPISVQVNEELFNQFLRYFTSPEEVKKLDSDKLKKDLYTQAAFLNTSKRDYRLEAYTDSKHAKQEVISHAIVSSDTVSSQDISSLIEKVKTIEIGPNAQISLLEIVKKANLSNPSNELLSLWGSSIYQTIINSNFDILERHISRQLPEGIEPGFEAKIAEGKQDLVFFNPNFTSYVLKFELVHNSLKTTLQGEPLFYRYEAVVKDIEKYEPKTIVQFNAAFPPNVRNIEEMGREGMVIKVYRDIIADGADVKSVLLAEDFYPPVHMIEQRGFEVEEEEKETVSQEPSDTTDKATENDAPSSNGTESKNGEANDSSADEQQKTSPDVVSEDTKNVPVENDSRETELLEQPQANNGK
ncbi:VanW family protein [Priestia abyssalis]|uniref:VanW family protein n=1 Tax=Priestia abyssalis TaxID=1221450 RepID=UPI000995354A|nr:VanW family protein [Priestia abyssalis]